MAPPKDTVTISRGRTLRFRPVSALTAFLEGLFSQPLYVAMQRLIKQSQTDESRLPTPEDRIAQAKLFRRFACAVVDSPRIVMGEAGAGEVSVEKLPMSDLLLIWQRGQEFLRIRLPASTLAEFDRLAEDAQQRMIGLHEAATSYGVRPSSWFVDLANAPLEARIAALDFDMAVLLIGRDFERRTQERQRAQASVSRPRSPRRH